MSVEPVSLPLWIDEDCNDYSPPTSRQVLRIAINLKQLIDTVIPVPQDPSEITSFNPDVHGNDIIDAVYRAAGGKGKGATSSSRRYQACIVFCLLKVSNWFATLAQEELADNELYYTRCLVAQKLASVIIDRERDDKYLFLSILCHRYTINLNDVDSDAENALELAVDMNATLIISTSAFQRCIKWLWRGWIIQSKLDPSEYVLFKGTANIKFWDHFHPDRIQTPLYQNFLEIFFSFVYLVIYTIIINIDTDTKSMNFWEILFLLFTLGFALDEIMKFSHIGWSYLQFQNAFNDCLYSLIFVSYAFRILALFSSNPVHADKLNITSYRFLSCSAPFMWTRMFFFCDIYKFFGIYMVIMKKMLKESILFFFLLSVVIIGFLQAFTGLDQADGHRDLTQFIVTNMLKTILSGPDFQSLERFAYPYGSVLYYMYCFLVLVMLLNILIALFSQAYSDVVASANGFYLHQYATRVLHYIRAPDSKIFFPPLNLIEIFLIDIPFKWFLNKKQFDNLCTFVMNIIYFFPLIIIANYESKTAARVKYNRSLNHADDGNEVNREWILDDGYDEDANAETNTHLINKSLRSQREAEDLDPEFKINFKQWRKQIEKLAPPIKEAQSSGVSLDNFEIVSRLEKLAKVVDKLSGQITEMEKRLN